MFYKTGKNKAYKYAMINLNQIKKVRDGHQ